MIKYLESKTFVSYIEKSELINLPTNSSKLIGVITNRNQPILNVTFSDENLDNKYSKNFEKYILSVFSKTRRLISNNLSNIDFTPDVIIVNMTNDKAKNVEMYFEKYFPKYVDKFLKKISSKFENIFIDISLNREYYSIYIY